MNKSITMRNIFGAISLVLVLCICPCAMSEAVYYEPWDGYIHGDVDDLTYVYPFVIEGPAEVWTKEAIVYPRADVGGEAVFSSDIKSIEYIQADPLVTLTKGAYVQVIGFTDGMAEIQTQDQIHGYVSIDTLRFYSDTCRLRMVITDTWCLASPDANTIGDRTAGRFMLTAGTKVRIVGIYGDHMYLIQVCENESKIGYIQASLCRPDNYTDVPDNQTVQVLSSRKAPLYRENTADAQIITSIPSGDRIGVPNTEIDADFFPVVYWYDDTGEEDYFEGYIDSNDVSFFIAP